MICKKLFVAAIVVAVGGSCFAEVAVEPAAERTPQLAEWESLKYGMFLCFGMSTFEGIEISEGKSPSTKYAPTHLDVLQWVRTAKQAGMKYIVLTTKHVAGHCLWDSKDYDYDVATSGNKTDVVAEFMKACKAEGIKPCLYYCVLDSHNEGGVKWCATVEDKYFKLIKHHITELHTQYPGIYMQWIDIPTKLTEPQRKELYGLVKKLTPNCLVIMNRGEHGIKVDMGGWPSDSLTGEKMTPPASRHNPIKMVDGKTYYVPMEVCDTIGKDWFWVPGDQPKDTRTLYTLYSESVGRGANLLLSVPPDKTGRIPQESIDALMKLKAVIDNPAILSK